MRNLNFIRFLSGFLIVSLLACKGNSGEQEDSGSDSLVAAVPVVAPEVGSLTGDTLNIGGKFVLFFGAVESADSMQTASSSHLEKFKSTSSAILDSLSSNQEIKAAYSTAGFFRIYAGDGGVMIISKSALNADAGLLMTDGSQPPTIKKGVLSSGEYHLLIKNYFFLK